MGNPAPRNKDLNLLDRIVGQVYNDLDFTFTIRGPIDLALLSDTSIRRRIGQFAPDTLGRIVCCGDDFRSARDVKPIKEITPGYLRKPEEITSGRDHLEEFAYIEIFAALWKKVQKFCLTPVAYVVAESYEYDHYMNKPIEWEIHEVYREDKLNWSVSSCYLRDGKIVGMAFGVVAAQDVLTATFSIEDHMPEEYRYIFDLEVDGEGYCNGACTWRAFSTKEKAQAWIDERKSAKRPPVA